MAALKILRASLFLSQEELARKSKLTVATISRLENGKQKPHFVTVRKLAKALNVDPKDIDF